MSYDRIIRGGRWFDGTGAASAIRHLGLRGDRLVTVSETPLDETGCPDVVDAAGKWALPTSKKVRNATRSAGITRSVIRAQRSDRNSE